MRALLALLLLTAVAPTAAAACDPTGAVCVVDESFSDGDCASGGFEGGVTSVSANAGVTQASVTGSGYCSGNSGENSVVVSAAGQSATWGEFYYDDPEHGSFSQCFIMSGKTFETCPPGANPPNPGWGTLLP